MPPQTNPRLTPIQHKQILAYSKKGFSLPAVASRVGAAVHQVRDYLQKHRSKPGLEVPITPSQSRLIQRYRQSPLTAEQIAAQLGIDLWTLQEELGSRKSMSTRRIGLIKHLLAEAARQSE
jgi:hypothetical protein